MQSEIEDATQWETFKSPAFRGKGSGKTAWIEHASRLAMANENLVQLIEDKDATIADLQSEVALLRRQIATRKPKGGRPRTAPAKVAQVERLVLQGRSTRAIASHCRVSAMTVSRISKRMAERGEIIC